MRNIKAAFRTLGLISDQDIIELMPTVLKRSKPCHTIHGLVYSSIFSLRELDLSLLSQLWSLNESIQEFRQMQEAFSPPSPSSDVEDDIIYSNLSALPEHQAYPLSSSSSRSSTMDLGDV
ncbi:hypothetical protein J6590_025325 [Homalodisca vitripennis]|nr:hypothetical protein J6590_025325 [Homalodisca vitripennis]